MIPRRRFSAEELIARCRIFPQGKLASGSATWKNPNSGLNEIAHASRRAPDALVARHASKSEFSTNLDATRSEAARIPRA
jgi:hypothetical protein